VSPTETETGSAARDAAKSRRDHGRTLLRYALFQIPELAFVAAGLALAVDRGWLSQSVAAAVFGVWILKDATLFWFVRSAYAPGDGRLPRDPRGQIGVAPDGLDDEGYVRLGPERWRSRRSAKSGPIAPGGAVRVVALDGLTVEVEAWPTRPDGGSSTGHGGAGSI
jgi:membrane protein implicated in regulation of membrane protease activity